MTIPCDAVHVQRLVTPDGLLGGGVHQGAQDAVGSAGVALHDGLGVSVNQATPVTAVQGRPVEDHGVLKCNQDRFSIKKVIFLAL